MKITSTSKMIACAFVALVSLGAASLAQAQSESFSATVPNQTTDLVNVPFTGISEFNPSLGTLTSVEVELTTSGSLYGTLTNVSTGSETFKFTSIVTTNLDSTSVGIDALLGTITDTFTDTTGTVTLASSASKSYGLWSLLGGPLSATYTTPADLALFEGTGNLGFLLNTSSLDAYQGGGGNIANNSTEVAGGTVEVIYNYTMHVPEGGSSALYLMLATLVCGGAMFFSGRNRNAMNAAI